VRHGRSVHLKSTPVIPLVTSSDLPVADSRGSKQHL
jgi:hypothetical protein